MKTIITTLLLSTTLAQADTKKAEPTDAKLAQLVGRWEGKSSFTLRGQKSEWTVTMSCQRATLGPPIICMSAGVSGEMRLEEVWMVAYDRASDTYHLFMANDWGEAYDHAAKWTDTAQVSFVHSNTREGKPLREEYRLTFKAGELTMYGALTVDGKPIGEGTTKSKRVP